MEPPPSDLELQVFVDSKSEYYLDAWKPALAGTGHVRKFNLAAFFLGPLWLMYRKMYLEGVMLVGAELVVGFVIALTCALVFRDPWLAQGVSSVAGIAIGGYVAAHANHWYLVRALHVIEKVRARGLAPDAQVLAIARRGGTNPFAAFGFLVVLVALMASCLGGPLQLHQPSPY